MANQFYGFSPEAFEQFVRALAVSVFGPGVTTFGNGPDGGREAIFRGSVPYPYPPATQWSGYGVIQAKCKEKSESTKVDQRWALALLDEELKAFVKSNKRQPKPDYYVFVTNVELSSVAGGGRDIAEKLLKSYRRKLGLKDYAVWDANQLNGFLVTYESLRKRFTAYLTPGDLLAAMLADLERRKPSVTRILTAFLERELRADEASRLDQAGNRTEQQLRLAHLFFDLPVSTEPQLAPPEEILSDDNRLPHGVLWELLVHGSRKLDPKAVYEHEVLSSKDGNDILPTRYVLLGGPGSGKSTVSQFLAQIHRAALLERRDPILLEPQARDIIRETREFCETERLSWPSTPRYPFKVELNRFAKALASKDADHVETLERYILNSLAPESNLGQEDLLEWLADYPWLLILDGLDEVPATSNRDSLVKSVNDFLAGARQVGADLFVVATSRQQGYAAEFASGTVSMRHVLPLSTVRALRYVERYAEARFGANDPTRAQDLVSKLRNSAKRQLTAQLMSSPLQVTFMVTVVAAKGDPGEDRWQLFDSYYRTIYDRERQKAVPPYDAVLSKQAPTIDRLHHDIGFWLQYKGEVAGGTAVSLPIAQFESLVDNYLSELGREGAEKEELVRLITDAASIRLVFLTSRVTGELSFEVRSLQEYMAAECIMTGESEMIKARLKSIAPAPYWRNVFLFAASKCFADARSRHLQDSIRLLCEDLNGPGDAVLEVTRAGSELAVDVLQSGAVLENPNHARHLARIGMNLLAQPYVEIEREEGVPADQRLFMAYRPELKAVYSQEIELRVGQMDVSRTIGAWPLLLRLVNENIDWPRDIAKKYWPADRGRQIAIIRQLRGLSGAQWLRKKIMSLIKEASFEEFSKLEDALLEYRVSDPVGALAGILSRSEKTLIPLRIGGQDGQVDQRAGMEPFEFSLTPLSSSRGFGALANLPLEHPDWLPLLAMQDFFKEPNRKNLAKTLRNFFEDGWGYSMKISLKKLPWPLAACLDSVKQRDDLLDMARKVESGAIGDTAEWKAAEERWRLAGLSINDIKSLTSSSIDNIAAGFFPIAVCDNSIMYQKYQDSVLRIIFEAARDTEGAVSQSLSWFLVVASAFSGGSIVRCLTPLEFRGLYDRHSGKLDLREGCIGYPSKASLISPWVKFFEWLGNSDNLGPYRGGYSSGGDEAWCAIFQRYFVGSMSIKPLGKSRRNRRPQFGLLRMLGRLATEGHASTVIPSEMLRQEWFLEPRFRLSALLIRLTQSGIAEDEYQQLADSAALLLEPLAEADADQLIFETVESQLDRIPSIVHFILRLHGRMPLSIELGVSRCEHILRQILRRRASDLQGDERLRKLGLPIVSSS